MILSKATLGSILAKHTFRNNRFLSNKLLRAEFADEKEGKNFMGVESESKKDVQIDPKYRIKSAALYDKYLESRDRPLISLDNYQINYCWIMQRIPIFIAYRKEYFDFYKNRYQMAKKAGAFLPIPKELQIDEGDYLFEEYEKANPENIPSHETMVKGQTKYYRENARYWRYTDPTVSNDQSVQNHSSDNVFFIVQNQQGQWIFPERTIALKETHDDFFKNFAKELFSGEAFPNLYFGDKKPLYVTKADVEGLPKGKGIKTFYYKGYSMSGIPQFPTNQFKGYKWVTKAELSQHFSDQYFQKTIRLAEFQF